MSITGISALSGTPLIAAASQITRGIDSNPAATGNRVFTWPTTGNAQNLNVVDYTNNNMISLNAGSLSWNNAQGVAGATLASADVQKFKKISNPVNMNSYDNPGWETAGTITTANPFGVAINPSTAFTDPYIYNSRMVSQYLGNSLWNIDLYVAMSGTPKADYGTYSNFLTIQSGHISAPTNSNVYDEWNSCFGCIYQDTIYSTALNFNATKPYDATRKHYINLHMLVAEW